MTKQNRKDPQIGPRVHMSIRVKPAIREKLDHQADCLHRTRSTLAEQILDKALSGSTQVQECIACQERVAYLEQEVANLTESKASMHRENAELRARLSPNEVRVLQRLVVKNGGGSPLANSIRLAAVAEAKGQRYEALPVVTEAIAALRAKGETAPARTLLLEIGLA